MSTQIVDDAITAVASLTRRNQILVQALTRLHRHTFEIQIASPDTAAAANRQLVRTMSETRTLLKSLGGD